MNKVNIIPVETKKKYQINREGVSRLFTKLFSKVGKPLLLIIITLLVLYFGFISYINLTNTPQKVRITNQTGRSATVSWVTQYPSHGEVIYSEEESFSFGPFASSGKKRAYDDRDYAYAQLEQMQDIVDLKSEPLNIEDVVVTKQGKHYAHHVTVTGLKEATTYNFQVGNGFVWWGVDKANQEYLSYEVPTISKFWFSTLNDPDTIRSPQPAYGRVYTIENVEGVIRANASTDAIVYSFATRQSNEEVSMLLSSATNLQGGWTIDKANFRDLEGLSTTFEEGVDNLYVYAQFEDLIPKIGVNVAYGVDDSPAPAIIGNGDDEVRIEDAKVTNFISKLISSVDAWCVRGIGTTCPQAEVDWSKSSTSSESVEETSKPANEARADEWWKAYEADSGDDRSLDNVEEKDNKYWNGTEQTVSTKDGDIVKETVVFVPKPVKEDVIRKIQEGKDKGLYITKGPSVSVENEGDEGSKKMSASPTPVELDSDYEFEDILEIEGYLHISSSTSCPEGTSTYVPQGLGDLIWAGAQCWNNDDLAQIDYQGNHCGREEVRVDGKALNYSVAVPFLIKKKIVVDHGECSGNSVCGKNISGNGTCKDVLLTQEEKEEIKECEDTILRLLNSAECVFSSEVEEVDIDWSLGTEGGEEGDADSLLQKAYAGDIEPTVDDTFVYFPSDGLYEVFFDGNSVGKRLALQQDGEVYYIDRDGLPGYLIPSDANDIQDNEDIIFDPTSVEITASKIAENFQVELKEGVNIVSFPFIPMNGEDALRASDLMGYTNTSYIRINHITFFEDGKWKPGYHALSTDETTNSGEDFVLTMGKGYLIIADEDMLGDNALQVPGRALESEIPIAFKPGWNLIGVHGYIQSYSARTLLDSVNTLDGITSDNVTWWPTSKGRYEGFQKSEGIEYGFDYPIIKDLGYFVRVSDFEPADPNTKSIIWSPGTDVHNTVGNN